MEGMSLETLLQAAQYIERSKPNNLYLLATSARDASVVDDEGDPIVLEAFDNVLPRVRTVSSTSGRSRTISGCSDSSEGRRRNGGSGTREVHNQLEKNRRAHLKDCFDQLKDHLPGMQDRKASNLSILRGALRHIQVLKRKCSEYEQACRNLESDSLTQRDRIAQLTKDLCMLNPSIDVMRILSDVACDRDDEETASDSTATADDVDAILSDDEQQVEVEVVTDPLPATHGITTVQAELPNSVVPIKKRRFPGSEAEIDTQPKTSESKPVTMTSLLRAPPISKVPNVNVSKVEDQPWQPVLSAPQNNYPAHMFLQTTTPVKEEPMTSHQRPLQQPRVPQQTVTTVLTGAELTQLLSGTHGAQVLSSLQSGQLSRSAATPTSINQQVLSPVTLLSPAIVTGGGSQLKVTQPSLQRQHPPQLLLPAQITALPQLIMVSVPPSAKPTHTVTSSAT